MYTRHGYHIKGTAVSIPSPETAIMCGGPGVCRACTAEAFHVASTAPSYVIYNSPDTGFWTKKRYNRLDLVAICVIATFIQLVIKFLF